MNVVNAPERPTLQSARRRSWRLFLLQEWSLLLLAVALTFIIWWIVRDQVHQDHLIEKVAVRLEVEEHNRGRLAAVLTGDENTVDLTLHCSRREKEEVEAQLRRDGWRVVMLVRDIPTGSSRELNRDQDRFQWKFADERILTQVSRVPQGKVFRIETREAVVRLPRTIPSSEELDAQGIIAEISVSPDVVDLLLPQDAKDDPLEPDPIDLRALLARADPYDQARTVPLTFESWQRSSSDGNNPNAYRRQMKFPAVQATVTLRAIGTASLRNDLLVLIDQKRYEYEEESIQGVQGVLIEPRLTFEGELRGTHADLEKLRKDEEEKGGHWYWGVRVKEPKELPPKPREGAESVTKTLSAEIYPVLLKGFERLNVRFVPKSDDQQDFDIKVRWHSKQH